MAFELLVATKNKKKLEEIKDILLHRKVYNVSPKPPPAPTFVGAKRLGLRKLSKDGGKSHPAVSGIFLKYLDLKITSLADYEKSPRIIENGKTFQENAVKKAVKTARFTKKFTLGEDSGLCVEALGGRPGIYSSRFSGKNKSDSLNNLKVLKLLEGLSLNKRKAYYACAVALADKDGLIAVVEGKCRGLIGFELKGSCGFGYDPLFIIPKYKKTFAQLGEGIKHKISHRYRALKKAKINIEKYIEKHSGN